MISVSIEKDGGKGKVSSNLKVTDKDLELIRMLQGMGKGKS